MGRFSRKAVAAARLSEFCRKPMGTFFTNAENNPCTVQESISLSDCLACSGCITADETAAFAPDLSFLSDPQTSFIFVISPQVKQSIYGSLGSVPYRAFEAALLAHLRKALRARLILDTSYFAKSPSPAGLVSSECPAVVLYIERVFPTLAPLLSTEHTYQQLAVHYALDWMARERANPETSGGHAPGRCKIVAVMQCYDKKDENGRDGTRIDYFLGARDLFNHIKDGISLSTDYTPEAWEVSHGYPDQEISGLENVINILKDIKAGRKQAAQHSELRICKGGCIRGPAQPSDYAGKCSSEYTEVTGTRVRLNAQPRIFSTQKKRTFNVDW